MKNSDNLAIGGSRWGPSPEERIDQSRRALLLGAVAGMLVTAVPAAVAFSPVKQRLNAATTGSVIIPAWKYRAKPRIGPRHSGRASQS